ncbi:hypothetical protein HDU76_013428 [Blyttiomyces sp. JEL0837]|nr:hypothetical protein HDU76_013428 [Blyttiomyces sp. JEL0837]
MTFPANGLSRPLLASQTNNRPTLTLNPTTTTSMSTLQSQYSKQRHEPSPLQPSHRPSHTRYTRHSSLPTLLTLPTLVLPLLLALTTFTITPISQVSAYYYAQTDQTFIYWDLEVLQTNKDLLATDSLAQRSFKGLLHKLQDDCEKIIAMGNGSFYTNSIANVSSPNVINGNILSFGGMNVTGPIIYSVTAKNQSAASGDKHDYLSLARYYWPNPLTADGLPYVRRDGQVNPEVDSVADHDLFKLLIKNVQELALGYFYLDEERYATELARIVRQWFLDPKTAMNPNLNYGSVLKGAFNNTGRNQGCLDFNLVYILFDSLALIQPSGKWTVDDDVKLKRWFSVYMDWLWFGRLGGMEREMANNHGTWYLVQIGALAMYLNRTDIGAWMVYNMTYRLDHQIDMSQGGVLKYEVVRAASFYYSTYQLRAYMIGAKIAMNYGVDLFKYSGPNNQSIVAAIDFLLPHYLNNGTTWAFSKAAGFHSSDLTEILKEAHMRRLDGDPSGNGRYIRAVRQVEGIPETHNRARLWSPMNAFDAPVVSGVVRGLRVESVWLGLVGWWVVMVSCAVFGLFGMV